MINSPTIPINQISRTFLDQVIVQQTLVEMTRLLQRWVVTAHLDRSGNFARPFTQHTIFMNWTGRRSRVAYGAFSSIDIGSAVNYPLFIIISKKFGNGEFHLPHRWIGMRHILNMKKPRYNLHQQLEFVPMQGLRNAFHKRYQCPLCSSIECFPRD